MTEEFNLIQDKAEEWFEKKPDAESYPIPITLLTSWFDCGHNKAYEIAESLVSEYPDFIKREKGKIVILNKPLFEYLNLKDQEELKTDHVEETNIKYLDLKRKLVVSIAEEARLKGLIAQNELVFDGLNKRVEALGKKAEAMIKEREIPQYHIDILTDHMEDLKAEKLELQGKKNELIETAKKKDAEIQKDVSNLKKEMESIGIDDERYLSRFGLWLGNWLKLTNLSLLELLGIIKVEKEPMKKLYEIYQKQRGKEDHTTRNKIILFLIVIAIIILIIYYWSNIASFFNGIMTGISKAFVGGPPTNLTK